MKGPQGLRSRAVPRTIGERVGAIVDGAQDAVLTASRTDLSEIAALAAQSTSAKPKNTAQQKTDNVNSQSHATNQVERSYEPKTGVVDSIHDLRRENEFLRDTVGRLNIELARYQSKAGSQEPSSTVPTPLDAMNQGASLPNWLRDPLYLSPLIVAYDERLHDVETEAKMYKDEVTRMKDRVSVLVKENDHLVEEVARNLKAVVFKAEQDERNTPHIKMDDDHVRGLEEQLELLREENVVMDEQLRAMQMEIDRMRTIQEDFPAIRSKLEADLAEASKHKKELERFMETQGVEIKTLQADMTRLVEERDHLTKVLSSDRPMVQKDEHDRVAKEVNRLSDELQAVESDYRDMAARLEGVTRERDAARKEAKDLVKALRSLEERFSEIRGKERETYQKIKESASLVEEAHLDRDRAVGREQHLVATVEALTEQLRQQRASHQDQFDAEITKVRMQYESQTKHLREQLAMAEHASGARRAEVEKLQRSVSSFENQLTEIRKTYESDNQGNLDLVESLYKQVHEANREREEAVVRCKRLEQDTRAQVQNAEARRAEAELQASNLSARLKRVAAELAQEKVGFQRLQTEVIEASAALDDSVRKYDADVQSERAAFAKAKREYEDQLHLWRGRTEEAQRAAQRAAEDLEATVTARDDELARVRNETQATIDRLDARIESLLSRLSEVEEEADVARNDARMAAQQRDVAVSKCKTHEKNVTKLRSCLEASEAALLDHQRRSSNMVTRETKLLEDRKQLQKELDRLRIYSSKLSRRGADGDYDGILPRSGYPRDDLATLEPSRTLPAHYKSSRVGFAEPRLGLDSRLTSTLPSRLNKKDRPVEQASSVHAGRHVSPPTRDANPANPVDSKEFTSEKSRARPTSPVDRHGDDARDRDDGNNVNTGQEDASSLPSPKNWPHRGPLPALSAIPRKTVLDPL